MDNKPSSTFRIAFKYLGHLFSARHRRGHGVHSPLIYEFVRKVVANEDRLSPPPAVKNFHAELRRDKQELRIVDLGAGSRVSGSQMRSVASIVRRSSVGRRQAEFLYRLCAWFRPSRVIEFGTGVGISTAYISAGSLNANIVTIEGSPEKQAYARQKMPAGLAGSIEYFLGHFDDFFENLLQTLEDRTIVFIDGDHTYDSAMRKVKDILQQAGDKELIVVLDDIFWSKGMEAAWQEIVESDYSLLTIDMFYFGIIFSRPGITSQHFVIKI